MGMSNAASVAPARLSAVPKRASPVMVKVWVGPCRRTRTCWPTLKLYFWAVPRSMTTSCGVVGGDPCTRCSVESCDSGSHEIPMVGAPPVLRAFPFDPMYCA